MNKQTKTTTNQTNNNQNNNIESSFFFIVYFDAAILTINNETSVKYSRKVTFLGIHKELNLCIKAEKQLQNKKHIEDWALGCPPCDNGCMTH